MKKAFQDENLDKGDGRELPGTHLSSSEKAFQYLFSHQNSDGGWGASRDDASSILLTAMALISLKQCPQIPPKVVAVNKAVEYLLSRHNKDGGFGDRVSTVKETALVCHALHGIREGTDVLERAKEFISSAQSANGSWNGDLYSTILALEAFSLPQDTQSGPGDVASVETLSTGESDAMVEAPPSERDKPQSISELQLTVKDTGTLSDTDETSAIESSEARERTQHTKISLVSRRNASASAAAETPDSPAGKDVTVQSVGTDRKKYLSHETVYIYSTIDNRSDVSRSIVVNAQIANSDGHIIDAASHDTHPSVNLEAGVCEPVTLSWYTGMNPPGPYSVRFHVADAADGRILDERKITFSISPAIVIEDLSVSAHPVYCSANETETIELKVAFQNRSNTDAPLKAELFMKDPEGNTVHQDSIKFELPASVPDAVMELNPMTYNFKKCGQYIIETAIRSGNILCSQAKSAIHVNPVIRIEAMRSLDPPVVAPGGEKAIQVGIRLEGVGLTTNPSVVHAQTNTVGDIIYITCDKALADPTGNELSFSITADKVSVQVRDICLDIPDITTFKLTLDRPLMQGQEIYISCSSEDLTCVEGKPLMPFNDERVANRVSPPIFNQDGYGFSGSIPPKPLAAKTVMT
ncbi:MAG: A-macroglobulin complement component, partial [Deltaproteobacteria bacterium]|nr:A-macroglobulin complement component [Deltaproteobacteria bacterium]